MSGESRVSRTMRRQASDWRVRRGLCNGNPMVSLGSVFGLQRAQRGGGKPGERGRFGNDRDVAAFGQRARGRRADGNGAAR